MIKNLIFVLSLTLVVTACNLYEPRCDEGATLEQAGNSHQCRR